MLNVVIKLLVSKLNGLFLLGKLLGWFGANVFQSDGWCDAKTKGPFR